MKIILLPLFLLALVLAACASKRPVEPAPPPPAFAVHPVPHEPHYLNQNQYADIRATVAPLPAPLSREEFLDDGQMIAWQLHRTPAQCSTAESQVHISLESMYGEFLSPAQLHHLDAFFADLYNDSAYMISQIKKEFSRPRPFVGLPGLEPCILKEKSASYPSGHAGLSEVYALILGDFFPAKKNTFLKRAGEIGQYRIISGVHYPSDIDAGNKVAKVLREKFLQIPSYRTDFSRLKKTLPKS